MDTASMDSVSWNPAGAPPRAALFDLDGTLADTLDDIAGAVNGALASAGLPTHEAPRYKLMVGNGFRNLVHRALEDGPGAGCTEEEFEGILLDARERYARHCLERTHAYEGVPALLSALAGEGIRIAVLSNKPDAMTVRIVSALFPGIPFVEIRGERTGVARKPDPGQALEIAAASGLAPGEWLYVGDSGVDMRTARGAGMFACGVTWGFRGPDELMREGASILVARPLDILAIFGIVR